MQKKLILHYFSTFYVNPFGAFPPFRCALAAPPSPWATTASQSGRGSRSRRKEATRGGSGRGTLASSTRTVRENCLNLIFLIIRTSAKGKLADFHESVRFKEGVKTLWEKTLGFRVFLSFCHNGKQYFDLSNLKPFSCSYFAYALKSLGITIPQNIYFIDFSRHPPHHWPQEGFGQAAAGRIRLPGKGTKPSTNFPQ